jgi:hypothetical protein
MTRTQGTESIRPQTAGAESISRASSRRAGRSPIARRGRLFARRELLALPAALALLAPTAPALAQTTTGTSSTGTSGYNQKPPTPKTKTEPTSGTAPSKESTTPTPTSSAAPAVTTPVTPKASTLPFTGLNLTWVVGVGVLLLAGGLSIRLAQRTRAGR